MRQTMLKAEMERHIIRSAATIQRQHRELLALRAENAQLRAEPRWFVGWLRRRIARGKAVDA